MGANGGLSAIGFRARRRRNRWALCHERRLRSLRGCATLREIKGILSRFDLKPLQASVVVSHGMLRKTRDTSPAGEVEGASVDCCTGVEIAAQAHRGPCYPRIEL